MSHQGFAGWFPECIVCGNGNLGAVVCLNPVCQDQHEGQLITNMHTKQLEKNGHYWQLCHWCDHAILSDPLAWGTYAMCADCWNDSVKQGKLPRIKLSHQHFV